MPQEVDIVAPASGKTFEIAEEGQHQAVLAEVRDLGLIDTNFQGIAKKVRKILFRWQLKTLDSEGQPLRVYERHTLSLHEKSSAYKRIKGLFGKEPPKDLKWQKLEGTNTMLVIVHGKSKDGSKTYANIAATLKLPAGTPKLEIVPIDPPKNAQGAVQQTQVTPQQAAQAPIDMDDIPF